MDDKIRDAVLENDDNACVLRLYIGCEVIPIKPRTCGSFRSINQVNVKSKWTVMILKCDYNMLILNGNLIKEAAGCSTN